MKLETYRTVARAHWKCPSPFPSQAWLWPFVDLSFAGEEGGRTGYQALGARSWSLGGAEPCYLCVAGHLFWLWLAPVGRGTSLRGESGVAVRLQGGQRAESWLLRPRATEGAGAVAARDRQPCAFAVVICRWFLVATGSLRRSLGLGI